MFSVTDDVVQEWLAGAQKIVTNYRDKQFPTLSLPELSLEEGPRYIRVVRTDGPQRGAHCFIDRTTGDILKAASWKAPAKHARGNLGDEKKGLGSMGPYGTAYLR